MKSLPIAVAVFALIGVGVVFVGGVSPNIVVAPEHVFTLAGLQITNTMFTSWWVVVALCIVAFVTRRGLKLVPSGFAAYVEAAVVAFLGIAEQVAGEKNGRRFFPLVATIFFFILTSNYFGLLPINNIIGKPEVDHGAKQVVFSQTSLPLIGDLAYIPLKPRTVNVGAGEAPIIPAGAEGGHAAGTAAGTSSLAVSRDPAVAGSPGVAGAEESSDAAHPQFSGALSPWFRSVNTDLNAPLAIALFSFIFVEFWGFQSGGPGCLGKFFTFGAVLKRGPMGVIDVFVGLLELVSELSRTVSFTFRLFGNIFAGEVLLLMMSFLIPFVLVDVFYGLEMFVGLIQAFVFAMLTLVFAVTAVSHHGGEENAEEHHGTA